MAEENGNGEGSIQTPIGSMSFKGKRTAEFIAILSLCLLFLMGYVLWEHKKDTKDLRVELLASVKELVAAQRETTCLLALPQEKREAEFTSTNGICKRLSR